MNRVLKLVADWRYHNDPPKSLINLDSIDPNEFDNNSWWYLHGKLMDIVHYDKAIAINCKSLGISKETINWTEIQGNKVINIVNDEPYYRMHFNGVISVRIEGIDDECIGYFWTTNESKIYYKDKEYDYWDQRGLVCLASDYKAREDAMNKMNNRAIII